MKEHYLELLNELQELTSYEGFVSTCIEIKEGMAFYDRDLVLAGYAGVVESFACAALLGAAIHSEEASKEASKQVRDAIWQMPERIMVRDSPLDIQVMAESFLRSAGWILVERSPVLIRTFETYAEDAVQNGETGSVDRYLERAQMWLDRDLDAAVDWTAKAGAAMLQGARLRPSWMVVAKPRLQVWLSGLQNALLQAVRAAHPYPVGRVTDERMRHAHLEQNGVISLDAYRRQRDHTLWEVGFETPDEPDDAGEDEVDRLIQRMFDGAASGRRPALSAFQKVKVQVTPFLTAMVEGEHLRESDAEGQGQVPLHAVRLLGRLKCVEGTEALIDLCTDETVDDSLRREALKTLEKLGGPAVEKVATAVERSSGGPHVLSLARVLEHMPRRERAYGALVKLFERVDWEEGKEQVAKALARYGDRRAIPVLEKAARDPELTDQGRRQRLQGAIRRLRRKVES